MLFFLAFLTAYLFIYNFLLYLFGGSEFKEIDSELKKLLEKAKNDPEALERANKLAMLKMRKIMRLQIFMLPLLLLFLVGFKYFSSFEYFIFGKKINPILLTFIYFLLISRPVEELVKKFMKVS